MTFAELIIIVLLALLNLQVILFISIKLFQLKKEGKFSKIKPKNKHDKVMERADKIIERYNKLNK